MGDKSGGTSKTYNYYGTLAGAVCIGKVEELVAILLDGNEVWPQGIPWVLGNKCSAGKLYVFDAQTWVCATTHIATNANAPGSGLEGWAEYTFVRGTESFDDFSLTASDATYYGIMRFYWGVMTQTVDDMLASTGNDGGVAGHLGTGDQHPDYEGLTYVVVRDFLLGQEIQAGPNIEIIVRRKANQSIIADAGITDGQTNLMAAAVEILTDPNCLGLPASVIDVTSFEAVAGWLQANQALYGASILIDSSENVTSILDKMVQMFDGYVRFNPSTKKIEVGVYQHGVTPGGAGSLIGGFTTLTADSFTKFPKFTTKSWQDTLSRATVRYTSRQLNYQQSSVQVDDPRAFFVLGAVREQGLDRPWIARASQALQHGAETLRVIGHAQMTGVLEVRREIGRGIRAGDYVLVDVDIEPNTNSILQFFRVTSRKIPPTGPITLDVFADNTLAPVPWNGGMAPTTVNQAAIPKITNFRFIEVPTALSGQRGAIVCLAQRPTNLLVGATIYFDTDPHGTFSALGNMSSYAARAKLSSAVAAGDATLHLAVDTTQVDVEYFTQQYSANEASNDTMLAILVKVNKPLMTAAGGDQIIGAGGDVIAGAGESAVAGPNMAGQVSEDGNGYEIVEICSVSTQTLISAGRYDLSVLRSRKNTTAAAFVVASTEVWLIPAALLSFFNHALFDQIRANRVNGTLPSLAQFRLCPYTFVSTFALSDALSFAYQFPLASASAPSLVLTAPGSFNVNYAPSSYPLLIPVNGTWTDPDSGLVEASILLRKSTDAADRVISDVTFTPTGSYAFATNISIEQAGSYVIKLIARDYTNISTEVDVAVTVTGAGAVCALAQFYDCNGVEIIDQSGAPVLNAGYYTITPNRFIPYGIITIKCSTPGSTISFNCSLTTPTECPVWNGAGIARQSSPNYNPVNNTPFFLPTGNKPSSTLFVNENIYIDAICSASGFTNSIKVELRAPVLMVQT